MYTSSHHIESNLGLRVPDHINITYIQYSSKLHQAKLITKLHSKNIGFILHLEMKALRALLDIQNVSINRHSIKLVPISIDQCITALNEAQQCSKIDKYRT
jgi:hypothetical protein